MASSAPPVIAPTIKAISILDHFYLFSPPLGRKEGEEEKKLLFYYPAETPEDLQVHNIGFCEAVFKFSESFAEPNTPSGAPYHLVSTTKQQQVYCQFETDFIMGLVINRAKADECGYTIYAESIYQTMCTAYRMYRLFFGLLKSIEQVEQLKKRLNYFFGRYMQNLKLHLMPLVDLYAGVQFMSLDSVNYLRIQGLVAELCETVPQIEHTLFLYQDQMLWYTVPKDDLPVLYRYVTQTLLPMSLRAELQPEMHKRYSTSHHYGKFITGPSDLDNTEETGKLPIIFIQSNGDVTNEMDSLNLDNNAHNIHLNDYGAVPLTEYKLLVYRALNATLVMLVSIDCDIDLLRRCDAVLGAQMTAIGSTLKDIYDKHMIQPNCHFVYFNPLSLSFKSSYLNTESLLQPLPQSVVKLACDLRDEVVSDDSMGDVIAKQDADWWLASKRVNDRELHLFMQGRGAALADINEDIKRICNTYFQSVYLNQ